jgi:antibiotic biosynthesis monooxygenase (ABM) superfamily enzyme
MTCVTWAAICPLITLILALLGPWLLVLPLPLRTFVLTAVVVSSMTHLATPWVTRRLKPWPFPRAGP